LLYQFSERLNELKENFSSDRMDLDRRLLIVERVAEDMLERSKVSLNAIDSYFRDSKQVEKFEEVTISTSHSIFY
jgi:hypothetical protein